MAMGFSTRVSLWLLGGGGKDNHHHKPTSAAGPPTATSPDFAFRDKDNLRLPLGPATRAPRPRPRWQSREERWRRVDREFDLVLVPSDGGGCLSGSDSDDSDWSVGWLEPHSPGFLSDGDSEVEGSFAVLVPCYGRGRSDSPANRSHAISAAGLVDGYSSEAKKYFEEWLSSLQSS